MPKLRTKQKISQSLRPHGRSGLKFSLIVVSNVIAWSPPTRAEWIEMLLALIAPPKI